MPVGLTGLAQVHGLRGDTSIDERARLDNQYIENWSLWHDLVILFQTFSAVIRNMLEASRRGNKLHDGTAGSATVEDAAGTPAVTSAPRRGGREDVTEPRLGARMDLVLAAARALGVRVRTKCIAVPGDPPTSSRTRRQPRQPGADVSPHLSSPRPELR